MTTAWQVISPPPKSNIACIVSSYLGSVWLRWRSASLHSFSSSLLWYGYRPISANDLDASDHGRHKRNELEIRERSSWPMTASISGTDHYAILARSEVVEVVIGSCSFRWGWEKHGVFDDGNMHRKRKRDANVYIFIATFFYFIFYFYEWRYICFEPRERKLSRGLP